VSNVRHHHALALALAACAVAAASLGAAACSSSSSSDPPPSATPDASPDAALAITCADAIDAIYTDPGALKGEPGSVLKCAPDRVWPLAELEAYARTNAYAYGGKPFTSGARSYRVSYETERGTTPPSRGFTSALVFLPDTPSANAPAIVAAHGTAGQAASCAPSKHVFDNPNDAYAAMIFPLVGAGYPVIVPDYAGYSNYGATANPPSGYAASADVGKSVLDGLRALRKMVPGTTSDKSIIVGHSQGGHSALSALAVAEAYGVNVTGVVTYSPLWFNQATWGALLAESAKYPIATTSFPVAVGIWYHYSHGELLDGPGHGVDVFAADKRAAIKAFFDTSCGSDPVKALGTYPADLYHPGFTGAIKLAAATGAPCGNAMCEKWIARYAEDRPHLVGKAKETPQLVLYGSADTTIPPDRATCGFSRLASDGAAAKICVVAGQSHSGIVGAQSAYVNDWIASVALGAPAPAPCAADEKSLQADGKQIECATPPPND
jgi:pimeloyl-ACP methyl ester carboxylesterase